MITDKRSIHILFWVLCTLLDAKKGFRQKMLALKHTDRCVVFFFHLHSSQSSESVTNDMAQN